MTNIHKYSNETIERIASFFEMSLSQDAVPIDLFEERLAYSEASESLERGDTNDLLSDTVGDLDKSIPCCRIAKPICFRFRLLLDWRILCPDFLKRRRLSL